MGVSHISDGDSTRDDVEGVRGPQRATDKGAKKSKSAKRLVLLKLLGCFVAGVHVPLHGVSNPRVITKIRSDLLAVSGRRGRHAKRGGGGERRRVRSHTQDRPDENI
jgi:hypothetical protein